MSEWEKLIPRPKSTFLRVKCLNCGDEKIIFSHTVNTINCNTCGAELAEPKGGKAKIKGEIIGAL